MKKRLLSFFMSSGLLLTSCFGDGGGDSGPLGPNADYIAFQDSITGEIYRRTMTDFNKEAGNNDTFSFLHWVNFDYAPDGYETPVMYFNEEALDPNSIDTINELRSYINGRPINYKMKDSSYSDYKYFNGYMFVIYYKPIIYNITVKDVYYDPYLNYEHEQEWDATTQTLTYIVPSLSTIVLGGVTKYELRSSIRGFYGYPKRSGYEFAGYKNDLTGEMFDEWISFTTPQDFVIRGTWKKLQYKINYYNIGSLYNPNPYGYDIEIEDTLELQDISDPSITFNGWYLNGEKVTSVKLGGGDISLYADITPNTYHVDFMVNGTLLKRSYFDYLTTPEIPEVPNKVGYVGSWDNLQFNELKDYVVNAVYKEDVFEASVGDIRISATSEESIIQKAYEAYLDSNPDKGLLHLVDDSYNRLSFMSYEQVKWMNPITTNYVSINSVEDFLNISNDPTTTYKLESDLDFSNQVVPSINTFTGLINGNGHTIKNIRVSENGLIRLNKGIIYNLNIKNISFDNNDSIDHYVTTFNSALLSSSNSGMIYKVNILDSNIDYTVTNLEVIFTTTENNAIMVTNNEGLISESNINNVTYNHIYKANNGEPNLTVKVYWGTLNGNIGMLCSSNSGRIYHSSVDGNFTCSNNINSLYNDLTGSWSFGLANITCGSLVGVNSGEIINSRSSVNTVFNNTYQDQNEEIVEEYCLYTSLGGLVGKTTSSSKIEASYLESESIEYNGPIYPNGNADFSYSIGGLISINNGLLSRSFVRTNINIKGYKANVGGLISETSSTSVVQDTYSRTNINLIEGGSFIVGGLIYKNEGKIIHSISRNLVDGRTLDNTYNVGGFIYTNTRTGDIRYSISYTNIYEANVDKYHFFGYENLLGFSYDNYYAWDKGYINKESTGDFDNVTPISTVDILRQEFLSRLGFYDTYWEFSNGEYELLGVRW